MPGSPPMRMTAPDTSPPPSTRSNSAIPVGCRGSSRASISARLRTGLAPANGANLWFWAGAATVSVRVFHSPQCGHLPSHFGQVPPHWLQTNVVLALALAILTAPRKASAAIYAQHLARDEAGFGRQEESYRRGHVGRLAQPSHRDGIQRRLSCPASRGGGFSEKLGVDRARRHGSDSDAIRRQLECPRIGTGQQCSLCSRIARATS